jgi:predicted MPP superfamily phosphohydrolase
MDRRRHSILKAAPAGAPTVTQAAPGPRWQWRGPSEFVWKRVTLLVANLAPALHGLRILHLSDFHTRRYWPPAYDTLLARIAADPPDLILFTGDFVESRRNHLPAVPHVKRLVAGLRARLGCYGTLGNHDLYHFAPHLDDTNVTLLEGARHVLDVGDGGAAIELIGFPGVDRTDLTEDFLRSLPRERVDGALRVVMSHFPDHLPRAEFLAADLFLTGHTHGGQVCLPGGHPIITHCRLPRALARGIHRVGPTWLVVNHGLGFSGLPLRLLCPSEVVEIRVERAEEMRT